MVHKEPDHLWKDYTCAPLESLLYHVILLIDIECLSLLIYIICKLRRFSITID